MAARTLSRTEGDALTESWQAVRPAADILITRTAY